MIGIDLGTTFSAAAYLDPDGNPQLVSNSRGARLTPSVVMEEDDGTVVVGEDARESMVLDRKSTRLNSSHDESSRMPSSA